MEVEIWMSMGVPGYEVSNLGCVRSIEREVNNSRSGKPFIKKGNLLKISTNRGYKEITICNKRYKIHRIVAEAFIPNPEKLPCINHKNGIRSDNTLSNLEWISYSDNNLHSFKVLDRVHPMQNKKGILCPNSKKVICATLDMIFNSITEAAAYLDCDQSTIIKICNGYERFTKGFYFRWV